MPTWNDMAENTKTKQKTSSHSSRGVITNLIAHIFQSTVRVLKLIKSVSCIRLTCLFIDQELSIKASAWPESKKICWKNA
jgi:hypothetical protein